MPGVFGAYAGAVSDRAAGPEYRRCYPYMTGRLYLMERLFRFPNPVNELAARTVAAGVLSLALLSLLLSATLGFGWLWLTVPLAYGFLTRVLTGPTLSPLGQL